MCTLISRGDLSSLSTSANGALQVSGLGGNQANTSANGSVIEIADLSSVKSDPNAQMVGT